MKIIDCFLFSLELEMLFCRLELLWNYVDYFIIVEANTTHTGIEKPFVFEENKHYFSKYSDKIVYVKVEDMPILSDVENYKPVHVECLEYNNVLAGKGENHQRECGIRRGMSQISIDSNDLIISSDLDEIPDPKCFPLVIERLQGTNLPIYIDMDHFWGDFSSYKKKWEDNSYWRGTAFQSGGVVKKTHEWFIKSRDRRFTNDLKRVIEKPRYNVDDLLIHGVVDTGCHFSWFGGNNMKTIKSNSFAHSDDPAGQHMGSYVKGSLKNVKLKDIQSDEQWEEFFDGTSRKVKEHDIQYISSIYHEMKKLYYEGNYLNDEKIDNI